jgi:hypothetical protein
MIRRVWIVTFVVGVATAWGGVARASGHGLDAMGELFAWAEAVAALVPWTISCALLFSKPSPRVLAWGTLTAGMATTLVLASELPPQAAYVSVALLPAVVHLFRRVRAELRGQRGGDAGSGDGQAGVG